MHVQEQWDRIAPAPVAGQTLPQPNLQIQRPNIGSTVWRSPAHLECCAPVFHQSTWPPIVDCEPLVSGLPTAHLKEKDITALRLHRVQESGEEADPGSLAAGAAAVQWQVKHVSAHQALTWPARHANPITLQSPVWERSEANAMVPGLGFCTCAAARIGSRHVAGCPG